MSEKFFSFVQDLREYAGPFYYGASTNGLGGVVFGVFSYFFNPKIPMPQTLFHLLLRVLFGASAGVAYSLGGFGFSLPYISRFADDLDKHAKSGTARDIIYSFLSLGTSLFILVVSAYVLFFVYGGRIPVKMNEEWTYLTMRWFISSLSYTNWTEVALIPLSGILVKGLFRAARASMCSHSQNPP